MAISPGRRRKGDRPKWLGEGNVYTLLVPVTYQVGDEPKTLAQLQLRRLTAAEMLILDAPIPFTEQALQIIEAMTGLMRVVTIKLDAVDVDRIDDIFGYFMEPGSVTGATS